MRTLLIAAATLLTTGLASAQNLVNVPVDTTKLIVQPADTATNILSGTAKYMNRVVADAVDSNGFVKTLNNLLGRSVDPKRTTQLNSNLPLPTSYQSTRYKNSFQPAMPTTMQYGQSFGGR